MRRLLKYLWVLPATALGLLFVSLALCSGGRVQIVQGAVETCGGLVTLWLKLWCATAMTIGHVILGQTPEALRATRLHEHIHIQQYERLGIFFIPAYFLASLWALLSGKHAYYGNPFEQEAFQNSILPPYDSDIFKAASNAS
ncbi:MAG: hypothetical protein RMI34_06990 [Chloroherpetonaceae bacterium]|nr:hypothetical protein [Chloroherpetonaceae bacterium]MCS7210269.1 hypothetical protein [Chloroherpetonaceae bacterium]MDW8019803.1 hypothetical protein [Chloroherpetonaceae bacterium]MDW8464638.1 hypothetical protein [Chloroherpetonaceae bacterium]